MNTRRKISYSGANKLLFSPTLYKRHYIDNEREDKLEPHLIEGKLVHLLLLEDEKLLDKFIVSPSKTPSTNTAKMLYKLHTDLEPGDSVNLEDHSDRILQILVDINLHQSLKTDEQRLAKIINDESAAYFKYLREADGKDVVDEDTYLICKTKADALKNSSTVMELLQSKTQSFTMESDSEVYIKVELPERSFDLHGFIDNYVIDHDRKLLRINDVKTTSKPIQKFDDSIDYYRYHLQAGFYLKMLIASKPEYSEYTLEYNFIVIDSYNQVCVFTYSDERCKELLVEIVDTLDIIDYHLSNNDYELPYDVKEGRIYL